ncbi:MAG: AMP-binding protein [Ilumatobacteraceae bacterium]
MLNLASIVDAHDADTTAIISRGRATSYGDLRRQIEAFRGSLTQLGVKPGDRVAMLCGNGRWFVVAYMATVGMGAIAVPMNPLSPTPELQGELEAIDPIAVVVEASGSPSFSGVDRTSLVSLRHIVITDEASAGALAGAATIHPFDELLQGPPTRWTSVPPHTPAVLIFTSGTAGAPRAAILTHGNLLENMCQNNSTEDHILSTDVVFGVLPMFHIFGLNVVLGMSLMAGATVVLVQRFDPLTAIETIEQRKVTIFPGAPPVWVALSLMDGIDRKAFASVRLALTGAARMPEDAMERMERKFGVVLREGYGLTEASPVVTSSVGIPVKRGSVGKALAGVDVRVVDDEGEDVPVGDSGEVWVRGANVFDGYWNDPDATARVLDSEGWLHTGDVGMVDDDGYLYLLDRAKDLIIVSGFNVYPAEVEDVLLRHPAVFEAGVVGVPHPHTGEAVRAYVVLKPGAEADEDTLVDHCHEHIARYKCPNKVLIVDQLPHNYFGKLLRRSL